MGPCTETVTKKLFTIDEFQRMLDAGIFPPDTRFELIRGEIIQMPETRGPHTGRVNKLNRLFTSTLGEAVIVSVQIDIAIPNLTPMSCPRPDVALLKPMPEFFGPFAPVPDEVLLLVEISQTTVRYDRETKAALYAEAGNRGILDTEYPRKDSGGPNRSSMDSTGGPKSSNPARRFRRRNSPASHSQSTIFSISLQQSA